MAAAWKKIKEILGTGLISYNHTETPPTRRDLNSSLSDDGLFSEDFTVESEAGAIAGLVFGILVVIAMVSLFLFMLKRKRDNDREYQKQLRIQRSTKQNAGVYMDTTTEDLVRSPREVTGSTAYASLRPKDDLYEYDSEDEI